jgi:hypothetical protein
MGQLIPRWIMQPRTDLNITTLLIKTPTSHDSSSPRSPIISVKGKSGNSASPDPAVEVAGKESRYMGKVDVARMSGRRLIRGGSPAGAAEVGTRVE